MVSAAKFISGAEDDGITFTMKKMNNRTFTQTVSFEAYQVMGVIFQWILPIITLAIGIVVFIRRARR
jgi:paraquat-inducible protein B